ncbi:hypothetical protein M758_8G044300 [Ceratodon purpureus]|nr:hypothetical protein M758_8G044300 [Ceratodon purpureus]
MTMKTIYFVLLLFQIGSSWAAEVEKTATADFSLPWKHELRAESTCTMYGVCAERSDGKALNCPYATPAVTPSEELSQKIQSLCPKLTDKVCCTSDQFFHLRDQVQQAVPFLTGCPACLRNYLDLFCEIACSPNQSLFIDVTDVHNESDSKSVQGVDVYVTEDYGSRLYDSCKDVKYSLPNMRAMDFVGGGANNYTDWFGFLGKEAELQQPGSSFNMKFRTPGTNDVNVKPLDLTVTACSDPSLTCSCGDCPSAAICTTLPPNQPSLPMCAVSLGSYEIGCLPASMMILYGVILFILFGWWWTFHAPGIEDLVEPLMATSQSQASLYEEADEIQQADQDDVDRSKLPTVPEYNEAFLADGFRYWGEWIARNVYVVVAVATVVTLILCTGLLRFSVETDLEKLWVNPNSQTAQEKAFHDEHLGPFYRTEQLIISTISESGQVVAPGIVTDKNLLLMFDIQKKVDELRGNVFGKEVSLQDICARTLGSSCATQSILQYFKMDPDVFAKHDGVSHSNFCFKHYASSASCLSASDEPVDPMTILGGFAEENFHEATAFVITYPVVNSVNKSDDNYVAAVAWEHEFIRLVKEEVVGMVEAHNLTVSFSSESSMESESDQTSHWSILLIPVIYAVIFLYLAFMLGDRATTRAPFYVTSKVLLSMSGMFIAVASLVGSVGVCSAFGVKSNYIALEVISFLVLTLGVNNMFLLVNAMKRHDPSLPLEKRVGLALAEVGPSITLTSLTEFVVFSMGVFSSAPACQVLSGFAAVAILLQYFLQMTAFVALLTLDFRRTERASIDCLPCLTIERSDSESSQSDDIRSSMPYGDPGALVRFMQNVYAPFIANAQVQAVVLGVFAGMLLLSIVLLPSLSIGVDPTVTLPADSYLQKYIDDVAEHVRVGPPVHFIVKDYNYSSQTESLCSVTQCDPNSLLNEVSRASLTPETSFIARPASSWLDDFLVWISPDSFRCCRKFPDGSYCPSEDMGPSCSKGDGSCTMNTTFNDCTTCLFQEDLLQGKLSASQFHDKLPWFLQASPTSDCTKGGRTSYQTSLDLTGYESGVIKASEFRSFHTPLNKGSDFTEALRSLRDLTSNISARFNITVFPYSPFYIFFDQYLEIVSTTVLSICLPLVAVFGVSLLVTTSIWVAIINSMVTASIVLNLLGLMVLWNIQLNAISITNLMMAIGISVEFCAHITHAFTMCSGRRSERISKALAAVGPSIFSGITLTNFLGIAILFFSQSRIIQVYYFRMYLSLLILGAIHGFVFLPVSHFQRNLSV